LPFLLFTVVAVVTSVHLSLFTIHSLEVDMRLLVIGNGGREHALAWKLAQSPHVTRVYVAPGNGGTATLEKCENVAIAANDISALLAFAREKRIDLTMVGPEEPLVLGVVDAFQAEGLKIFGPSQAAAQLEGSKSWAKAFMEAQGVPTAAHASFTDYREALKYVMTSPAPPVVKVSGLAAGKGVYVPTCFNDAEAALYEIYVDKKFGDSTEVVIEEMLQGPELSVLAFCDGVSFKLMPTAQDHKRLNDGDEGPNTGGMGAYAPVPTIAGQVTADLLHEIGETVFRPVLDGLAAVHTPYVGILYAGLMMTPNGIKVLEFNCRFGDPETQVILPLLESDLVEILLACLDGRLNAIHPKWSNNTAATVVMAAGGYPSSYQKGDVITGLEPAAMLPNVNVFHAGTALNGGQIVTNGGRVLAVTGVGHNLASALDSAYAGIEAIDFEGAFYRRDIGKRALA
jgi:phosphoribosylamine--glycine ligase